MKLLLLLWAGGFETYLNLNIRQLFCHRRADDTDFVFLTLHFFGDKFFIQWFTCYLGSEFFKRSHRLTSCLASGARGDCGVRRHFSNIAVSLLYLNLFNKFFLLLDNGLFDFDLLRLLNLNLRLFLKWVNELSVHR